MLSPKDAAKHDDDDDDDGTVVCIPFAAIKGRMLPKYHPNHYHYHLRHSWKYALTHPPFQPAQRGIIFKKDEKMGVQKSNFKLFPVGFSRVKTEKTYRTKDKSVPGVECLSVSAKEEWIFTPCVRLCESTRNRIVAKNGSAFGYVDEQ